MRAHRFIGDFDLNKDGISSGDQELIKQLKQVLRLSAGDRVVLCNGKNQEREAEIKLLTKDQVEFELLGKITEISLLPKEVTLYCAVLKKENFELVVQQATEVGVTKIVPITTKRTELQTNCRI